MALTLPPNFEKDIQSKDTNLFPIVVIGDYAGDTWDAGYLPWVAESIFISTNIFSNNVDAPQTFTTLPLLLNVPSIKESIDIEKRNYKISSVNIDISNYEYEGKRFSELVENYSLINKECRIYWWSPSTSYIEPVDIPQDDPPTVFQAYNGKIRRYDHDDEKVRLVVEDKSQSTLHVELPKAKLDATPEVPDKYKNKPIPMVYGHVDRSPMVIKTTPTEESWGEGNIEILADNNISTSEISTANYPISIYANDTHLNIPNILDIQHTVDLVDSTNAVTNIFGFINNTPQFDIEDNLIKLSTVGSVDDEFPNPVFHNQILGFDLSSVADLLHSPLNQISQYWTEQIISGDNVGRSWYGTMQHENEFAGSLVLEEDRGNWQGGSFIDSMGGHWESGDDINIYSFLYNTTAGDNNHHERAMMGCSVQTGTIPTTNFTNHLSMLYFDIGVEVGYAHSYGGSVTKSLRLRVGGDGLDDTGAGGKIDMFIDVDVVSGGDWHSQGDKKGWTTIYTPENLLIYCRIRDHSNYGHGRMAAKIKINDLRLFNYALIEDMLSQDFYANVNGRQSASPHAPDIISHILTNELGQDITGTSTSYPDWHYAFTVDKKINSKKLIEGIASASPYIPRFNNLGEFKFDVIEETYPPTTDALKILSDDVIDWTNSRTKIENVYTKVVFEYNWDYAGGKFNSSYTTNVRELFDLSYNFDYYGFPANTDGTHDETGTYDPHSESTLVINDDRGKYIRNETTAEKFATWMLLWSMNQHLIMKVKLPLKYMNLEIGDIIEFDSILGGVKPYGISYINGNHYFEDGSQALYPYFMITSTNKTLEHCEISCVQMHYMGTEILGCMDSAACNYNPDATEDDGECKYRLIEPEYQWCFDEDGDGYGSLPNVGYCPEGSYNQDEIPDGWVNNCIDDCEGFIDCNGDCFPIGQGAYGNPHFEENGYPCCTTENGFFHCVGGNTENPPCVPGCLDVGALNYDSDANCDIDNSYCQYPSDVERVSWCLNPWCDTNLYPNCVSEMSNGGFFVEELDHNQWVGFEHILYYGIDNYYAAIIFKTGYGYAPYSGNLSSRALSEEEVNEFITALVSEGTVFERILVVEEDCAATGTYEHPYLIGVSIDDNQHLNQDSTNYDGDSELLETEFLIASTSLRFDPYMQIPGTTGQFGAFGKFGFTDLWAQYAQTPNGNQISHGWIEAEFYPEPPGGEDSWNWVRLIEGADNFGDQQYEIGHMDEVYPNRLRANDSDLWATHIVGGTSMSVFLYFPFDDNGVPHMPDDTEFRMKIRFLGVHDEGSHDADILVKFNFYHCTPLGDINADNSFNVLDIVTLANLVLGGNWTDWAYACACDINGDGDVNVLDIVLLANCVLAQNCGGG